VDGVKTYKDRIKNLSASVNSSYSALSSFRASRSEVIRKYCSNYGDNAINSKNGRNAVNMLEMAIKIYTQKLISGDPRVKITPLANSLDLKLLSRRLERGVNAYIKNNGIKERIELAVKDAFFSMGIMKVAKDHIGAYAEHVSLNDWVHDMSAKSFDKCEFMGNRYEVLLEDLFEMYPDMSKEAREHAKNSVNGYRYSETESVLTTNSHIGNDALYDKVQLWDIYLPLDNKVVVLLDADTSVGDVILSEYDWGDPVQPPFITLGMDTVPDNTMPLAPAMLLESMSDFINDSFHKLRDQAMREKTVYAVQPGDGEDAKRVMDAGDGECVSINNPNSVKEMHFGGINQTTLAMFLQAKNLYSWLAGNLDMLGGLSPQSKTMGQDQLLAESASDNIRAMQQKVSYFIQRVLSSITDHIYHDSNMDIMVAWEAPGMEDMIFYEQLTPVQRFAEFRTFNIQVDPYTLVHQSPQEKIAGINAIVANTVAPFMQDMAQQGISLDYERYFKTIAEYANLPELNYIIQYSEPRTPAEKIESGASMPSTTRRIYERRNIPSASRQQQDETLSQMMMGNNRQPAETAPLVRGIG
jgi:hypothetical protein